MSADMIADKPATDLKTAELRTMRKAVMAGTEKTAAAGIDPLLSSTEFSAALGVGRTKFWEMSKAPGFPAAVVLSARCVRYKASAVRAYIEALSNPVA